MNLTHALHALGGEITTIQIDVETGIEKPPSKDNPYMFFKGYDAKTSIDMRMLAMAYTAIADHLEELNNKLKDTK